MQWWILCLTILTVQIALGEETLSFDEMPLDELISFAKAHAPMLKEAQSKIALAKVEMAKTHWLSRALPSATFYWGTNLGIVSIEEGRLWEEQGSRMRWAFNLNWSLGKLFGEGRFEHRKAKLNLQRALIDHDQAERLLMRNVTQTWLLLENLKREEEVLRKELSEKEQLVEYNAERYRKKRITYEELSKAKVEFHRTELKLLECLQEQLITKQQLMDLIG